MATITTVTNQKGGQSKTTTTWHLGEARAQAGQRVLLVDTDPSSNLTRASTAPDDEAKDIADVLQARQVTEADLSLTRTGIPIIRGSKRITVVERELLDDMSPSTVLKETLRCPFVHERFDVVLIDTPPNLGLIAINALIAADEILIPVVPEPMALFGLRDLLDTIASASARGLCTHNARRIVPVMVDRRVDLTGAVLEHLQNYDVALTTTQIPRNVRVASTVGRGLPVFTTAKRSPGALAYRALADELYGVAHG